MIRKTKHGLYEVTIGGEMVARVPTRTEAVVAERMAEDRLVAQIEQFRLDLLHLS